MYPCKGVKQQIFTLHCSDVSVNISECKSVRCLGVKTLESWAWLLLVTRPTLLLVQPRTQQLHPPQSAVLCSTVKCSAVLSYKVQYCHILCSTVIYSAVLSYTLQHCHICYYKRDKTWMRPVRDFVSLCHTQLRKSLMRS